MDMVEIDALVAQNQNYKVSSYIESGEMPVTLAIELALSGSTFHYHLCSYHPMTQDLFDVLLGNANEYSLRQLAINYDLTTEMKRKLYLVNDDQIKQTLLRDIDDKKIVDSAIASNIPKLLMGALRNPLVTSEQLAAHVNTQEPDVLNAIVHNPNADSLILTQAFENIGISALPHFILGYIVTHPNVSSELIEKIYKTHPTPTKDEFGYMSYLESFAKSPRTPAHLLTTIAAIEDKTYSHSLVKAVIANPQSTAEIQRVIVKKAIQSELHILASHENTHPEILAELKSLNNAEVSAAMVRNKSISPALFTELFNDPEAKVRAAFGLRDDLKPEHIRAMVADKSALVREAVAYYDVEDISLLEPLIQDSSAKVHAALISFIDDPKRKALAEAAKEFKSGVKPKKKPVTIGDKVALIKEEALTQARFEELAKEESVTLRVAGIMRGHEIGLIDLKTAVKSLDSQGGTGVAPKEAWLKDRALNWQGLQLDTALDMQFWFKSSMEDLLDKKNVLPEEFLIRVIKVRYGRYNELIFRNQTLTKACLLAMVDSEMVYGVSFIQVEMLDHPLIDIDVYTALAACKFKAVRNALFAHKKTPMEVLKMGLEDKDGDVRGGVIANDRFTFKEVERFLQERGYASKVGVLRRIDCPAAVLTEHASSKQMEVRLTVAANPSTPMDSLLLLAADGEKEVRRAAVANPVANAEVKAIASLLD
jgi:hypothetical protein